jgi:hypothetical protein
MIKYSNAYHLWGPVLISLLRQNNKLQAIHERTVDNKLPTFIFITSRLGQKFVLNYELQKCR